MHKADRNCQFSFPNFNPYRILKLLNQRDLEHLKEKWWTNNPNKKQCPKLDDEADGISIQNIGKIILKIGLLYKLIILINPYPGKRDLC